MSKTDKNRIDKIFTGDSLPPLFGDSFKKFEVNWNKIEGVDFELVGRILICHLIIEHYLNMLIELEANKEFDFDNARLTFNQKLKLIGKIEPFKEIGLIKGIEIVNKIRNKFSHNLKVQIDSNDIMFIKDVVDKIGSKEPKSVDNSEYSDLATIESFTSMTCSFMAGYCTATVHKMQKLKKLVNVINQGQEEK